MNRAPTPAVPGRLTNISMGRRLRLEHTPVGSADLLGWNPSEKRWNTPLEQSWMGRVGRYRLQRSAVPANPKEARQCH